MKVGDYVRTKRGIIGKIKLIDNQTELEDLYLVKRKWYYKEDFIKSSPNIIDLIETGDYVNGYKVLDIYICITGEKVLSIQTEYKVKDELSLPYETPCLTNKMIKSIVTKEQFASMEYRVESEVN